MRLSHQKVFRKALVLLIFIISVSFSPVSFAQSERGLLGFVASLLQTSLTKDSDSSRWNILFGSPQKKAKTSSITKESTNSIIQTVNSSKLSRRKRSVAGGEKVSCVDSDGGSNEFQYGEVTFTAEGEIKHYTDETLGDGVLEFFCDMGGFSGEFIVCENGSADGACLPKIGDTECLVPLCETPESGCHYEEGFFSDGCPNPCAKTICLEEESLEEKVDVAVNVICQDVDGKDCALMEETETVEVKTKLSVEIGKKVESRILVSGEQEAELLKIRLIASKGDLRLNSLQFANVGDSQLASISEFGLYSSEGELLNKAQLADNGILSFELPSAKSVTINSGQMADFTIKISLGEIKNSFRTAKKMQLTLTSLDASDLKTGDSLAVGNSQYKKIKSEAFIAYGSKLTVSHAESQPRFNGETNVRQEIYRFVVTADEAGAVQLGKLKFNLMLTDIENDNNGFTSTNFVIRDVRDEKRIIGSLNAREVGHSNVLIDMNFKEELFEAGETREYVLSLLNFYTSEQLTRSSSIQVSILGDESFSIASSASTGRGNVSWSDTNGVWFSGKNLDIDTESQIIRH